MRKTGTLLTLTCILVAVVGCSKKYDMKHYSPPDGSFTVSVPAPLEYTSTSADTPAGAGAVHSYSAVFDDVIYGVSTIDLPEQAKEDERHPEKRKYMLKAGMDGMLASNRWKLLSEVGDRVDISLSQSLYGQKNHRLHSWRFSYRNRKNVHAGRSRLPGNDRSAK
jgi:hypothetical protein